MNTCSVHQPNFLPWVGYFNKIKLSKNFVILDDVEYTKNGFINRNKILTSNGIHWITVPVLYKNNSKKMLDFKSWEKIIKKSLWEK